MPRVNFTASVNKDAAIVWKTIAAFGQIADWHPDIKSSRIENGLSDTVPGAIRHLDMQDGNIIREELLALDNLAMTLSYRFLDSPLPWDNYVCALEVKNQQNSSGALETQVTWFAEFEVQKRGTDAENEALLRQMILTGYNGLKSFLE